MPSGVVTRASTASCSSTVGVLQGALGCRCVQKLKFFSESGIADCITSASWAAWRCASQSSKWLPMPSSMTSRTRPADSAQFGRDQDAGGGVDVDVHRVAEEDALPAARFHRQRRDPVAKMLPGRPRENHQRPFGVLGDRQLVHAHRRQQLAMARRHRDTTFAIQRQRRGALKHDVRHKTPRKCTLRHFSGGVRVGQFGAATKINGINDLVAASRQLLVASKTRSKIRTCETV